MFLPITLKDKEGSYIEHLNVTHITRTAFVNPMNPDAGTKIYLRTGEILITIVPMDILQQEIDECWKSASAMIIFNIIAEKTRVLSSNEEPDLIDDTEKSSSTQ
jgi:hypothetical protein